MGWTFRRLLGLLGEFRATGLQEVNLSRRRQRSGTKNPPAADYLVAGKGFGALVRQQENIAIYSHLWRRLNPTC